MNVIQQLSHRETRGKHKRSSTNWTAEFRPHKWRKMDTKMSTATQTKSTQTESEKEAQLNGWEGRMIPGVDGMTQFGFPTKIITVIRYVEFVVLTSTTGSVSFNSFKMNSLFDPNSTGTGHQPMWFDNYSAIYDNYRVLGAVAKVKFAPITMPVATAGPIYIGINGANTTNSVSSTPEARAEMSDSVFDVIGLNTTYKEAKELFFTYSPESKLGRPNGDDTVGSGVNANPSQIYYIQPWISDQTGTSSCNVTVEIRYTAEFYGLNEQSIN